ncbi:restriction endonuclease subunit S [Staphylococcus equorum]|uniref:restriction endonuclease subunit S n=1 Tax=Staphylococcus equorum TaxID=246432 RepID=UPI0037D9C2CE
MTNDTKNVPELRFPGFSGEWEIKELGNRVKFYSGLTYTPNDVSKNGTLVLRSSNIFNNHIINADNVYVNSDKATSTYVEYGDVVVVVRNGSRNLIGKHAVVKKEETNAVIGAFMTGIRYEFGSFINALLSTQNFQKEIHKNLGATINQITTGIFKKMAFSFPKKQEEQKIGVFFSKLDRQIELEEQKLEKLKEQKKGYMQKIFSQEIRFKDDNGNDYPEWESKKFLDIFKLAPSKNNQIKSSEVVENGIIPVVDQGKDIFLGYSNEKDKAIEDFDNVIVYGDHTTIIKYIKEPFIIGGDGVKLLESNDGSLIHYLYILLQYFNVKPEGYKRHYSILKNKMMNISNTKEEQEKIGDFFNELDELIEKQSSKIVVLKQRKKGFLQKMFV